MKKPRRRVNKNYALRNELIQKGLIIPYGLVPKYLKDKGFEAAAEAAASRVHNGLPLHVR